MRRESCIHYRGSMSKPPCVEGIDPETAFKAPWPCWTDNKGKDGETCAKFCAPTVEQLAAHEVEVDASIHRLGMGMKAITDHEKSGRVVYFNECRIECPCCGVLEGLTWYRSKRRLYVACVTPDCLKFEANTGHRY